MRLDPTRTEAVCVHLDGNHLDAEVAIRAHSRGPAAGDAE
jgi:hypothetical protein